MFSVQNVKLDKLQIEKSALLEKYIKLIKTHLDLDGNDMLPKAPRERLSFELHGTYASFANAIRRVLIEELTVKAMKIDDKDIISNDEFITGMNDVLSKNISMVPIYQDSLIDDSYDIYLYIANRTNEIIEVLVSDIKITKRKSRAKHVGGKAKSEEQNVEIVDAEESDNESNNEAEILEESKEIDSTDVDLVSKLFPEMDIVLARLRPGKFLKLKNITFQTGTAIQDAGAFTLLDNITYKPLDIKPFNQFTGEGTRSIEVDCSKFLITFETKGTIKSKQIIDLVAEYLIKNLLECREKLSGYSGDSSTYYTSQDFVVELANGLYTYLFKNQYITICSMITHRCYHIDETIPYAAASVERYDTRNGICKIKHPDATKMLIKAIDLCIDDIKILQKIK